MFVEGVTTAKAQQFGYASLAVVMLLLVAITMVTLYGAQASALQQRMLGNEIRSISTFTHTEQALDKGIMFLGRNTKELLNDTMKGGWKLCSDSATALPCGSGTSNIFGSGFVYYRDSGPDHVTELADEYTKLYLIAACRDFDVSTGCPDTNSTIGGLQAAPDIDGFLHIIASGTSRDGTGKATARQSARFYPLMATAPAAPLIVGGETDIRGRMELITNPNGGGRGVPISIWSEQALGSSTQAIHSCEIDELELHNGSCPKGEHALTTPGREGIDIVDNAVDFPPDLFEYLFGVAKSEYHQIKDRAAAEGNVVENCRMLDADASGLYWIDGDCEIQSAVGSRIAPVLLVVADGSLTLEGKAEVNGLVFAFTTPDGAGAEPVKVRDTASVRGCIVSDRPSTTANGSPNIFYEAELLNVLMQELLGFGRVPGSWGDRHG